MDNAFNTDYWTHLFYNGKWYRSSELVGVIDQTVPDTQTLSQIKVDMLGENVIFMSNEQEHKKISQC